MINRESFMLYDELVKEDNYKYLFDVSIIYQCNETLNGYLDLEISDDNFREICEEVKRQYLKYEDVALNDELVVQVYNEIMGDDQSE